MDNEIEQVSEIIYRAFNNISLEKSKESLNVLNMWKRVLLKIKSSANPNEGKNLAEHTRVIDLKNGILLVEADHPGWIELLQLHKKFILKGMSDAFPSLKISTMAYKLKGQKAELFNTDKNAYSDKLVRKSIENTLRQEESKLSVYEIKNSSEDRGREIKKELPPELASIFEDLRKNMSKQ